MLNINDVHNINLYTTLNGQCLQLYKSISPGILNVHNVYTKPPPLLTISF